MEDIGERLNSVLNDPEQMKNIMNMAMSFMGSNSDAVEVEEEIIEAPSLLNGSMMAKLGSFMLKDSGSNDKKAMLEAMKPYLSEKRRNKVDRAMKLAKLSTLAMIVLEEFKEDKNV